MLLVAQLKMAKKRSYASQQARFYDEHPPLVPWPGLLREYGLSCLYKPREVFWRKELDSLGLGKGKRVLEVGCGQGLFLARLVKTYQVKGTGIDISSKSIRYAKQNFKNQNLIFREVEAIKIPYPDIFFDFVISFDTLEHIMEKERTVKEMLRVLKPGGKLLIYAMNKNDKFTLDWIWEKLGFDIYTRASHKRELFVDPNWLAGRLRALGASVINLELFDAFFSLGLDEAIMVSVFLFKKAKLFQNKSAGRLFFSFANLVSRALFPLLQVLDWPWYKNNQSLGFLIVAQKNEEKET